MGRQKSDSVGLADMRYEIRSSDCCVRDMPESIRPREEVERVGVENASDAVLIAILLRTGTQGCNVVDLAHGLLGRYGSLTNLAAASVKELSQIKGIGRTKAQMLKAALELGARQNAEAQPDAPVVKMPADVVKSLREVLKI